MNSRNLTGFIREHGISAELLDLEDETPTVQAAARAVGVSTQQIVKTLVFLVDGAPWAVIASGTDPVDRHGLTCYFGVGVKRVKLASREQVETWTGYPAGAVPPFGHAQKLPTLMDHGVFLFEEVFAGGGEDHCLLRIAPAEIERVTSAERTALRPAGPGPRP
jgi:prolyl-tRNA editing enzyme YbaK/EbsC (Cys-tRNA(Pro) deacylase)